jgi:hypothetical protein
MLWHIDVFGASGCYQQHTHAGALLGHTTLGGKMSGHSKLCLEAAPPTRDAPMYCTRQRRNVRNKDAKGGNAPTPADSPQRLQTGDLRDPLHAGRVRPQPRKGGRLQATTSQRAQAALRLRGTWLLQLARPETQQQQQQQSAAQRMAAVGVEAQQQAPQFAASSFVAVSTGTC